MDNPLPTPIGPFWTPPNYESLINKILLHTGGERTAAVACSMYAINLCRKIFDEEFGADTKLEGAPASSDEPEAGKDCYPVPDVSALPTDDTPAWQDKAKQQGGNLVGSGFVQAVISGEERLEQDEADALHPAAADWLDRDQTKITPLSIREHGGEDNVYVFHGWVQKDDLMPSVVAFFKHELGAENIPEKWEDAVDWIEDQQMGFHSYNHTYATRNYGPHPEIVPVEAPTAEDIAEQAGESPDHRERLVHEMVGTQCRKCGALISFESGSTDGLPDEAAGEWIDGSHLRPQVCAADNGSHIPQSGETKT